MLKNTHPGKFIVFEGPDGSGQTTQASLLEKYFCGLGKKVVLTKEPTLDSKAGLEIKDILNHEKEASPEDLQKLLQKTGRSIWKKLSFRRLKREAWLSRTDIFFQHSLSVRWELIWNGLFR